MIKPPADNNNNEAPKEQTAMPRCRSTVWRYPVLLATLLLAGCEARSVQPIGMSQPGDDTLTCAQLDEQIAKARADAGHWAERDQSLMTRNTVIAIVGPPMLIDLSREEQIKHRSALDRAERLEYLKRRNACAS